MSLPLPTTLSPSKISAFKHCPLQFRFSVIDRLPEPPSPPASKGTLVHRALELLMVRAPADRTPESAVADLDQARVELADHPEFAGLELGEEQLADGDVTFRHCPRLSPEWCQHCICAGDLEVP